MHIYIFENFYRTKAKHSGGLLVDDMARERGAGCNVNKSHGRKQGDCAFLFFIRNPFLYDLSYFVKQLLNYKCIFYSGNVSNIGQIYKQVWIVVVFLFTQWKKSNMHFTLSGSLQSPIKRFYFVKKKSFF